MMDGAALDGMASTPQSLATGVSTFNDVLGEGAVLNPVHFFVSEPHCDPFFDPTSRSVTLRLVRSLVARGVVSDDAFTACGERSGQDPAPRRWGMGDREDNHC
jgi:hypothetical protein